MEEGNPGMVTKNGIISSVSKTKRSRNKKKKVEIILRLLKTYFYENPKAPLSFCDFMTDPHLFYAL